MPFQYFETNSTIQSCIPKPNIGFCFVEETAAAIYQHEIYFRVANFSSTAQMHPSFSLGVFYSNSSLLSNITEVTVICLLIIFKVIWENKSSFDLKNCAIVKIKKNNNIIIIFNYYHYYLSPFLHFLFFFFTSF